MSASETLLLPFESSSSSAPHLSVCMPPYVMSPRQMFGIIGYTPQEGPVGTMIRVTVRFSLIHVETTFLRIVIGTRTLSTTVRASQSEQESEWELEAVIPELEMVSSGLYHSLSTVPLTVQAVNHSNVAFDTLTFGEFTYTRDRASSSTPIPCKQEVPFGVGLHPPSTPATPDTSSVHASFDRFHAELTRKTPQQRPRVVNVAMTAKDAHSARGQVKKQSFIRALRSSTGHDCGHSNLQGILQVDTPTERMAIVDDWGEEERRMGRRLVRFTRVQDGCTLHVACEVIQPSGYTDGDTVISCIRRLQESEAKVPGGLPASQCCITSVDIIFLLERLFDGIFDIEEKNRIRRNLDTFRPETVYKNKDSTAEFFQKIMDFPAPKPRNIEKDFKVFDWAVLPQALDKIVSKYTLSSTQKMVRDCAPTKLQPSTVPSTIPRSSIPTPYITSCTLEHNPSISLHQPYVHDQMAYHSPQCVSAPAVLRDDNHVAAIALSTANSYHFPPFHSHPDSGVSSSVPTLCKEEASLMGYYPYPSSTR